MRRYKNNNGVILRVFYILYKIYKIFYMYYIIAFRLEEKKNEKITQAYINIIYISILLTYKNKYTLLKIFILKL